MNPTISDLAEPLHSVFDRIPVQEMLDRVPHEVTDHLPERLQPEHPSSHRSRWVAILAIIGVGAAVVLLARRRSDRAEDGTGDLDLREGEARPDVSLVGGLGTSAT